MSLIFNNNILHVYQMDILECPIGMKVGKYYYVIYCSCRLNKYITPCTNKLTISQINQEHPNSPDPQVKVYNGSKFTAR